MTVEHCRKSKRNLILVLHPTNLIEGSHLQTTEDTSMKPYTIQLLIILTDEVKKRKRTKSLRSEA